MVLVGEVWQNKRLRFMSLALVSTLTLAACASSESPNNLGTGNGGQPSGSTRAVGGGGNSANDILADEILASARKVVWEKRNFSGSGFIYDRNTRLLWATGLNEARTFPEAKSWISRLSIDGLGGWRMPTLAEAHRSPLFPTRAPCNRGSYSNEVYVGPGWSSTLFEYEKNKALMISYSTGGVCARHDEWTEDFDKRAMVYAVRDMDDIQRLLVDKTASVESQLLGVARILLRSRLEYSKATLSPPQEAPRVTAKTLKKGEFEVSAEFEKRQKQEQARADAENARQAAASEQAMRDFQQRQAAENQKEAAWQAALKTPDTRQRLAEQALSDAFNLVLGSPLLRDAQYNTDKGRFDAVLSSSRDSILAGQQARVVDTSDGSLMKKKSSQQTVAASSAKPLAAQNWHMNLAIPVPLKEAQSYKARLLDTRLIPRITFDWNAQQKQLSFAGYEMLTNEVKQQREFANARQINSIEAYQEFIQRHPKAPQVSQAQQQIRLIQERQEKERREQQARAQAEAKAQQERAAAETAAARQRERLGCDNFYPGKLGKINGSVFWIGTVDGYVVRYVNKERQLVTIQGAGGSGALKDGQMHEMSCSDLISATRW